MYSKNRKRYLSYLIQTCMAELEEVVVTGSFIRNSAFAQNNPVDNVSQADILASGAPNMGNYIRDLSYTQNTNTVNSVNASASGAQTSVGTTFNLRGLGENSTLTLMDGMRSVDAAVNTLIPEIAIDRMEVVLDGGSALYGPTRLPVWLT
jgi:iron complex outermembrane recepter protein